jgi:hypothetical protein
MGISVSALTDRIGEERKEKEEPNAKKGDETRRDENGGNLYFFPISNDLT